jgi:hypothetical protein
VTPAELADRIGHTSYAVDGSAVSADGRVKIEIATAAIRVSDRSVADLGVTVTAGHGSHDTGGTYDTRRHWPAERTVAQLRAIARHLRDVAADWERAAQVAEELRAPKPQPTTPAKRKARRENARFARLDMDTPADQTVGGA